MSSIIANRIACCFIAFISSTAVAEEITLPTPIAALIGPDKYFESNGFRFSALQVAGLNSDAVISSGVVHEASGVGKGGLEVRFGGDIGLTVQGPIGAFDASLGFDVISSTGKSIRFASVESTGNGVGDAYASISARLLDRTTPGAYQEAKLLSTFHSNTFPESPYEAETFAAGIGVVKVSATIKLRSFDSVASASLGRFAIRFGTVPTGDVSGDYDLDGDVDGADFLVWQRHLGASGGHAADGSGNGIVDAADLLIWRSHFGQALSTGSGPLLMVPEGIPPVLATCGLATIAMSWCRRHMAKSRLEPPLDFDS